MELAILLAEDEYNLVLVSPNQKELDNTISSLKERYEVKIIPIIKDLCNRNAALDVYHEVKARGFEVSVFINASYDEYAEYITTQKQKINSLREII